MERRFKTQDGLIHLYGEDRTLSPCGFGRQQEFRPSTPVEVTTPLTCLGCIAGYSSSYWERLGEVMAGDFVKALDRFK